MEINPSSDAWLESAQALWQQGQQQAAIKMLVEGINASQPSRPRTPYLILAFYLFQLQKFPDAETVLSQYLQQHPQDYEALENRGVMRSRMGNNSGAYEDYQTVVKHRPQSVNAWDGLTAVLARLQRYEEASQTGAKALVLKNQQCNPDNAVKINWPNLSPQTWTQQQHDRDDIIAFSLWGSNPIYLRGAVRNLIQAPHLYPGWTCRFYVDDSVPDAFKRLAQSFGGQIIEEAADLPQRQKLAWRFQVASDPRVRRFLVRDADSVISTREVHAVEAWLKSDRWFHIMRDWWSHTDMILAGMWGGYAGLLEDLNPRLKEYQPGRLETANIDQWFLRDCVWPAIRDNCLIHDRCFRALDANPWPDPNPKDNFHVGQDESAVKREFQTKVLGTLVDQYDWLQLHPS